MKANRNTYIVIVLFFVFTSTIQAQFWNKIKKAAEKVVVKKVEKELDKKTDGKKSEEKEEVKKETSKKPNKKISDSSSSIKNKSPEVWRNFKFIPGEKVIFYDDLKYEEVGEFPSKWDLLKGGTEVATLNNEKVIIPTSEDDSDGNIIMPMFNNGDYLGDEFTIEFDIYIDNLKDQYDEQHFSVSFETNTKNFSDKRGIYGGYSNGDIEFELNKNGLEGKVHKDLTASYDNFPFEKVAKKSIELNQWHHVSISYYKKKLKVYFNDKRIVNLPNYKTLINGFAIKLLKPVDYTERNVSLGKNTLKTALKNIRLAHGGGQMYKRIMSEGKYVTNGILFDSGKAILKAQSMGVINKIVSILKEKPDWKFEIVGHTDNDGNASINLELSKKRAESVKQAIVLQGILPNRLFTVGKGETAPLNKNANALEKENNRRVEFIKMN
ncbi:OmpA family protein [Tenacibaculum ovolyticum]|uniref:OmpA family protein n=1 Tax=Tenacibaculum ovolyticum TaxID=104270 RepID=UPI00041E9E69|nr:OmpA family protein [Tenacibaculum ovolyticum]